jgi:hypothetical protein
MATVSFSDPRDRAKKAHMKTALLCFYCSPCYMDFPDCIGCDCVNAFLFCDNRCKCSLFEQSCQQTCCKSFTAVKCVQSLFCIVGACAIPPDDEVPCGLGICGFMCIDPFTTSDAANKVADAAAAAVSPTKGKEVEVA